MDNGRLRLLYLHLDFTRGIASRGRSDGGEHNGRFPGLFNAAFPGWSGIFSQAMGGDNGRSKATLPISSDASCQLSLTMYGTGANPAGIGSHISWAIMPSTGSGAFCGILK